MRILAADVVASEEELGAVFDEDDSVFEPDEWAGELVAVELGFRRGGEIDPFCWALLDMAYDHGARGLPLATSERLREAFRESVFHDVASAVRADEHSLRVCTAFGSFLFFDDHLAGAHPDRVAYLLHDCWELPDGAASTGSFDPGIPVVPLAPAADGRQGATYVIAPRFGDACGRCEHCWAAARPTVISGVRLPDLAGYLCTVAPEVTRVDAPSSCVHEFHYRGWPEELLALRALLAPSEARLSAALTRWSRWPGHSCPCAPGPVPSNERGLLGNHAEVHLLALGRLDEHGPNRYRRRGRPPIRLRETGHLVQMADGYDGYAEWVLFDDLWATAHADLARSLLRTAATWDPIDPLADLG